MSESEIKGVEVCVFDAYGTLFDFNAAAAQCRDALGNNTDPLSAIWREKQLQYTWQRSLMGQHKDFWEVTGDALDFAMETLEINDPSLWDRLMKLYLTLKPFPEVYEMLEKLKSAGMKTAILSNGSPTMLSAAVEGAGIGHLLDKVLSIEAAGIYKPHPSVYQLALDAFGVKRHAICFQSSNAWDAYGASAFGLRVVWCNRYGQRPEKLPGNPDAEVPTLAELPALLGI